jgi:hypothetical protein
VVVEGAHLLLELLPLMFDFGEPLLRRHVGRRCVCVRRLHRRCVGRCVADHHEQTAAAITPGLQFAAANAPTDSVDGDAEMVGRLAER